MFYSIEAEKSKKLQLKVLSDSQPTHTDKYALIPITKLLTFIFFNFSNKDFLDDNCLIKFQK